MVIWIEIILRSLFWQLCCYWCRSANHWISPTWLCFVLCFAVARFLIKAQFFLPLPTNAPFLRCCLSILNSNTTCLLVFQRTALFSRSRMMIFCPPFFPFFSIFSCSLPLPAWPTRSYHTSSFSTKQQKACREYCAKSNYGSRRSTSMRWRYSRQLWRGSTSKLISKKEEIHGITVLYQGCRERQNNQV